MKSLCILGLHKGHEYAVYRLHPSHEPSPEPLFTFLRCESCGVGSGHWFFRRSWRRGLVWQRARKADGSAQVEAHTPTVSESTHATGTPTGEAQTCPPALKSPLPSDSFTLWESGYRIRAAAMRGE